MFWKSKKASKKADEKDMMQVFLKLFADIEEKSKHIERVFSLSFGTSPDTFIRNVISQGDAIHGLQTAVAAAKEFLPYLEMKDNN